MFHVNMDEDGNLEGARFAAPIESPVLFANLGDTTAAAPSLSGDSRSTPDVNEAGVTLTAAGAGFSAGVLLTSGSADAEGGTFVAAALADMIKPRDQVAVLVDLFNDGGLDRDTLTDQLLTKWTQATGVVNGVFDDDHTLDEDTNPRRVVAAFDEVVDALSSEDAFIEATAADSDNVFDAAALSAANEAKAYAQTTWEPTSVLSHLGDTRFGAAVRGNREDAEQGNADTTVQRQAFAYATTEATRRASDVQVSGNAYYEGRTHAVDSDSNLYAGDSELQVRFTRGSVSGLVSNLETVGDGEAWSQGLRGAVDRIFLPDASLRRTGAWSGSGMARLSYAASAGGARDLDEPGAEFDGRLLGRGDEAGEQAIGTWQIGTDIAGGFGAQRVADRADPVDAFIDNVTDRVTFEVQNYVDLGSPNLRIKTYPDNGNARGIAAAEADPSVGDPTVEVKLSLAALFGDGFDIAVDDQDSRWAQQTVLLGSHVSAALEEITRLRNTLQKRVALDDADANDDGAALANTQRAVVLDDAIALLDDELFGNEGGNARLEPVTVWNNRAIRVSPGRQILAPDTESGYPGVDSGRPQDAAVLARMDAVIEALSDIDAFADAFDSGGIFDGAYDLRERRIDEGEVSSPMPRA